VAIEIRVMTCALMNQFHIIRHHLLTYLLTYLLTSLLTYSLTHLLHGAGHYLKS